jgi:hypothetical protein
MPAKSKLKVTASSGKVFASSSHPRVAGRSLDDRESVTRHETRRAT